MFKRQGYCFEAFLSASLLYAKHACGLGEEEYCSRALATGQSV
jgi:hypothetical protein